MSEYISFTNKQEMLSRQKQDFSGSQMPYSTWIDASRTSAMNAINNLADRWHIRSKVSSALIAMGLLAGATTIYNNLPSFTEAQRQGPTSTMTPTPTMAYPETPTPIQGSETPVPLVGELTPMPEVSSLTPTVEAGVGPGEYQLPYIFDSDGLFVLPVKEDEVMATIKDKTTGVERSIVLEDWTSGDMYANDKKLIEETMKSPYAHVDEAYRCDWGYASSGFDRDHINVVLPGNLQGLKLAPVIQRPSDPNYAKWNDPKEKYVTSCIIPLPARISDGDITFPFGAIVHYKNSENSEVMFWYPSYPIAWDKEAFPGTMDKTIQEIANGNKIAYPLVDIQIKSNGDLAKSGYVYYNWLLDYYKKVGLFDPNYTKRNNGKIKVEAMDNINIHAAMASMNLGSPYYNKGQYLDSIAKMKPAGQVFNVIQ